MAYYAQAYEKRKFLASNPPKPQQTVTSTDGKLEIPNVPKLAKKPAKKNVQKLQKQPPLPPNRRCVG